MNEEFPERASREGKLVLLDFNAPWCSTCGVVDELLENALPRLESKMLLVKVDIHQRPDLTERFHILSIPTTILLTPQGQIIWRKSGLFPLGELETAVKGAKG